MDSRLPTSVPVSVLDTSPIVDGSTAGAALSNTLDLAQRADQLGYQRYWVPEHHGMRGVASAATSVIIDRIASSTQRIRVGSGGVLLPNHPPLVLAEQFGTLEVFHPGRIDLGVGRALGGRRQVIDRIRSEAVRTAIPFEAQIRELLSYFDPDQAARPTAIPAVGNRPSVWLLGSTELSANLAGALSLPYAFAGHLNPASLGTALDAYRRSFRASPAGGAAPKVLVSVPVIAADTDELAQWLAASIKLRLLKRARGEHVLLPPPEQANAHHFTEEDREIVRQKVAGYIIGSSQAVLNDLRRLVSQTGCHELMITTPIYGHAERCRSYEICARLAG
jgi:luciferase family oxidoreductase group 1